MTAEHSTYFNKTGSENFTLSKEIDKSDKLFLLLQLIGALISVEINLRVLYIIYKTSMRRRLRLVNIFLAHLSILAISITGCQFQYMLRRKGVIKVDGTGMCEFFSFIATLFYTVFPLNVVCLINERIRTVQPTSQKFRLIRTLLLMWTISIAGCIPVIFMTRYERDDIMQPGKCRQKLLFGDLGITLAFEITRLVVFSVIPVFYVTYALYKIRSNVNYFQAQKTNSETNLNSRSLKRVRRIRFIYIHSILFIILWLPNGVFSLLYKLLSRIGSKMDGMINTYLAVSISLSYLFIILTPFIYFLLNENISILKFCFGSIWSSERSHGKSKGESESGFRMITGAATVMNYSTGFSSINGISDFPTVPRQNSAPYITRNQSQTMKHNQGQLSKYKSFDGKLNSAENLVGFRKLSRGCSWPMLSKNEDFSKSVPDFDKLAKANGSMPVEFCMEEFEALPRFRKEMLI